MTANPKPNPWAPDATHMPGEPGERGSSAFAGNSQFTAPGTGANQGATRAIGGEFGDAPTVQSDPAQPAQHSLLPTPISNQSVEDTRAAARTAAAAAAKS